MFHVKHSTADGAPAAAAEMFGPNVERAAHYVDLLATVGVERGLIGPREVGRLWERHVLNCAALAELIEPDRTVVDVGSGAGLPGIPLALVRPDLDVVMVEPMQRRVDFLVDVVSRLGLASRVHRGRADDAPTRLAIGRFDAATSRAVAALDRVAALSVPLLVPGGRIMAIKGERAATEVVDHEAALRRMGLTDAHVVRCGVGMTDSPTIVVVARHEGRPEHRRSQRSRRKP